MNPRWRCAQCVHLHEGDDRLTCAAFPNGIPAVIKLGNLDHVRPVPGDRGIRYERAPIEVLQRRFDGTVPVEPPHIEVAARESVASGE